ncbi:hypothetical protein AMATHDRAFT_50806 [Amanita thiersii Skay4041]|uniref:Uncharacterized protein n=1 Tax=Amanita thiersii Skay4041 TaxID=703135 RepID=A0A2A9NGD9_9AGAR|nr:hypothetical protein AMATHDRAFT_50806 [Amanita thiersii Skay4041]
MFPPCNMQGWGQILNRCMLLWVKAFGDKAFKGQFAISPALHGDDVAYYFPSTMNPSGRPTFDNVDFDNAFAQFFLNFAISLNPNVKTNPSNITPQWSMEGRPE